MTDTATTLVLSDAAVALIKADVAAFKRDGKRYSDYVAEMNVTADTVAVHVALFRDAYKAACPKADGAKVKAYATKVRNGLKYHVAKDETPDTDDQPVNYLTTQGMEALADLDPEALAAAIHAEVERRTSK